MTHFDLEKSLKPLKSQAEWVGLRYSREKTRNYVIRNERPEEHPEYRNTHIEQGVMVEVLVNGHIGYAATSDTSHEGLQEAFTKARSLAEKSSGYKAATLSVEQRPASRGGFLSSAHHRLDTLGTEQILSTLLQASHALKASDKIVTRFAHTMIVETDVRYASTSGAQWEQGFNLVSTNFMATAKEGSETQIRSDNGGLARCYQIGSEAFNAEDIISRCTRIGHEALQLLSAPNCPTDTRDLLLAPDQMMLQIHESIGHPLELDRILGDERNFAGWSFVKPEDFGKLQYGSLLMNVVFDPHQQGQFASYAFDDVGNPATREFLIKNGKLMRGLGSLESQKRLGLSGVANSRASNWNRAPIDRMANINVLPGTSSLQSMIASVEKGILMRANRSWSIDDYRNKFQFGCEYAELIENGKITGVVKNPNYRGKTLQFWNSLKAVGDNNTFEIYGTPFCGKGEPSQIIRAGHASPYCLFGHIEVFGGLS